MDHFNSKIEEQYNRKHLFENIIALLKEQGTTVTTRKDIAGIDEFHIRGAVVSVELAKEVGFDTNTRVLDIGCGLGGPCRMLADEFGCMATGIDLTHEFIRTAQLLSERVNLQDRTTFMQADALQLPFDNESFDAAWTQHVQMNIENKNRFYSEIKRVLTKEGRFIYYDIFTTKNEPLIYPVPWASKSSLNFLITTSALHQLLLDLGFTRVQTKDHSQEAINFFTELLPRLKSGPKTGMHLVIGDTVVEKLGNLLENIKEGRLEIQSGVYC
ncbi:MAG: class I SAM-dependent methyltransferase [Chitinophagaceae bacterium]